MPVPVTTLFPTVAAPGTPVPSAGEVEPGAFLAALASIGASVGTKAGEGLPVAEQALPLPGRIAPQVAAASVAAQQAPAEPVAAPAPPTATETPVAPPVEATAAVPAPPLAGTKAPATPATNSPVVTPPFPIASSSAGPSAEMPEDVSEAPTPAAPPVEVTAVAVESGLADPKALAPQPLVRPARQPTAAPVQKEQRAEAKASIDAPPLGQVPLAPVTPAVAAQAGEAPQPAGAPDVARPAKLKTTATAGPAPSAAAPPVAASAPGMPVIAAAPPAPTTPADPAPATAASEPKGPHVTASLTHAAPQAAEDIARPAPAPEARVLVPLFSQTLEAATTRPTALPYETARPGPAEASVSMREGHFGADVGVAIARALDGGRDALLIRLDPREMGRIDVRMGFDKDGTLRAVVSADQPAALDLLRRESTHLDRALSDAGVRADAQSLRFDSSGGGFGSGHGGAGQHRPCARPQGMAGEFTGIPEEAAPVLRSLRGSGNLDLMA